MRKHTLTMFLGFAISLSAVFASCGGDDSGGGGGANPCEQICKASCDCLGLSSESCINGCLGNCNCTTNCANANACRQQKGESPLDCASLCGQ